MISNGNLFDEVFIRFDSAEDMDKFYGIEFSEEEGSSFPNTGYSGVQCTGYACAIQGELGKDRVKVVGFYDEDNPGTVFGTRGICTDYLTLSVVGDGHDFAIVDDRYIVDPWITEFGGSKQGVFDLQDPGDAEVIRAIYGNPSNWTASGRDTRKW